jgi:putative transposase
MTAHGLSQRRACGLLEMDRTSFRYQSMRPDDAELRDECLNEYLFGSLVDAIKKIEAWRIDYNTARPHSSINNQTPAAFAAASVLAMQRGETLRYPRGFAPRPVATTTQTGSNKEQTLPSNG